MKTYAVDYSIEAPQWGTTYEYPYHYVFVEKLDQRTNGPVAHLRLFVLSNCMVSILTLKAPVTTIVVYFVFCRLL